VLPVADAQARGDGEVSRHEQGIDNHNASGRADDCKAQKHLRDAEDDGAPANEAVQELPRYAHGRVLLARRRLVRSQGSVDWLPVSSIDIRDTCAT